MWMENEDARQKKELKDRYKKRERRCAEFQASETREYSLMTDIIQSILARMIKLGHEGQDVQYSAAQPLGLRYLPYDVTEKGELPMFILRCMLDLEH